MDRASTGARRRGMCFAQEASLSRANRTCVNRSSHLPDLTSVKDGSLERQLANGDSTWIDAWIERGSWMWHSSDQVHYPNQGCFLIQTQTYKLQSSFLEHFELKASNLDQSGCTNYCMEKQYSYSGISMKNSETLECYCGNQVPLLGTVGDGNCAALCKHGKPICGFSSYARIITSKAILDDFQWRSNSDEQRQWCASLQYERGASHQRKYYSFITQSNCLKKMKALCVAKLPGTFGELPWADGQPALRNRTCIVAVKTNDEIRLFSSDCEAESAFICMSPDAVPSSSKPDKTTTKPAHGSRDIPEFTTASFAVSTASAEIAMAPRKTSTGWVVGGVFVVLCSGLSIAAYILIKKRLKSSSNGRPSTKDDGNQGEENAAHVYDEIPDDRMAANSGKASHEYENVNARTHNEPPQNMVTGIQANGQTANARSQHNDRHYVNMETARNLNEQQSDQLNRQASSPTPPQRQESKQGDADGASVYEGLVDVPKEIPNAYESIGVITTHE
ncbi:hypothetical protein CAPTEDRAFT_185396 [Capitella teleta]|uniref:WSC domain-containing protein n=1 Tax=Capitella teleta TaxID=283909 RepID=R7TID4_CAPTE|nr:hypothetical protein CAPTEDRAFT_185396 [Capitella teleta]|eukprot:ELT90825.1 hypothetical protein CAPTEDRAFT_185396 [Capitella teleta]